MTTLATPEEAREGTDNIVARVSDLLPLIKEAFERRYDLALGYNTWADYCDTELRGIRVPVESRREAIQELTDAGMSTRAIGSALGVGSSTVQRERTVPNGTVTRGLDGGRPQPTQRSTPTSIQATLETLAAADEEHARQVRVATSLLTDAVVVLAQANGTRLGEFFNPQRAEEIHRPVTQDTIIAAIETLDAVLAAFRERNLP